MWVTSIHLPKSHWGFSACCCCSVAKLCLTFCKSTNYIQHARLPCPSPSPGVCSNLCPLSRWCYLTISSSTTSFSFCFQSFPASGSFPLSRLFVSGGQSIGASTSASVLSVNIQGWFPLGLTGFISLLSQGLWRVFSSTTVQKHQFFGSQLSLLSNSHEIRIQQQDFLSWTKDGEQMVWSQLPGWLVFGANKENAFYSQRAMRTFLGGWTSGSALTLTSFGMWKLPDESRSGNNGHLFPVSVLGHWVDYAS